MDENGLPVFEVIKDENHITIMFGDKPLFEGELRPGLSDEDVKSAIVEAQSEVINHLIHDAIMFGMNLAQ